MIFEIFKTGTHTSDKGITQDYTTEDLDSIVNSFNENPDGVPVVVGHPADNSPAYAWLDKVERVDDKLIASTKDDNPDFLQALKNKAYKNRSVSLTPEGKLRHVGFLGGLAPAVKGLAPVSFSSEQGISIEMDMAEINYSVNSETTDEENNSAINKDSNKIESPEKEINMLNTFKEAFKPVADSFAEMKNSLDTINQNFSEGLNTLSEEELKKVYDKMSEINFKIKVSEFELMLNEKLAYGSVTPAMKTKIMSLIDYLNSQNFSQEFSAQKYQDDVNTLLTDLINSIPKIIHYENFAEKPESENTVIDEDKYGGLTLDEESSQLHTKALALMKKDEISYLSAVTRISKSA